MGLGSGAENHTLLLNLGISIHFKSTISLLCLTVCHISRLKPRKLFYSTKNKAITTGMCVIKNK